MPAPTLVASVQINTPWDQSKAWLLGLSVRQFASALTTQTGDLIVAVTGAEAGDLFPTANAGTGNVSDGTNTYTERGTREDSNNYCGLYIGTYAETAGASRTPQLNRTVPVSLDTSAGGWALQFRNHGGVGNVVGAKIYTQTQAITCSANSALVAIAADWNAVAGAQSWATINGSAPTATAGVTGDTSTWGAAAAYWADVGAAGSKTVTLSTPTMGKPDMMIIEILAGITTPSVIANYSTFPKPLIAQSPRGYQ
jgi:hypothetical protein